MQRLIDQFIEKLRNRILKMCSLVDEQVNKAIRSVEEENIALADEVIEQEAKVDKYDVKIEKNCQKIFALTQPVAMDLRFIMSALTINQNLERIGDLAVDVAESLKRLEKIPAFIEKTKLNEMFALAKEMMRDSLDAYINGNADLARKVIEDDDKMDKLNSENHDIVVEIMKEDCENIEPALTLLVISRHIERLGDHTTNIAEDVFFVVEAQMIKHKYEKYLFTDEEDDDDE